MTVQEALDDLRVLVAGEPTVMLCGIVIGTPVKLYVFLSTAGYVVPGPIGGFPVVGVVIPTKIS